MQVHVYETLINLRINFKQEWLIGLGIKFDKKKERENYSKLIITICFLKFFNNTLIIVHVVGQNSLK